MIKPVVKNLKKGYVEISDEEFRRKFATTRDLNSFFYYDLYKNYKVIIENADVIDFNLFFLLQNRIHPEVKERFWMEVNRELRQLVRSVEILNRTHESRSDFETISHGFHEHFIPKMVKESYELNCVVRPIPNLDVDSVMNEIYENNLFDHCSVYFDWTGNGDLIGEFTLTINIT